VKRIALIGREELAITKETTSTNQANQAETKTKIIQVDQVGNNHKKASLQKIRDFLQEQVNKSISKDDIQDNLRHRIDLVRIEEGYENLSIKEEQGIERSKSEEKTFIIGLDNQQFQAQVQIPPKK